MPVLLPVPNTQPNNRFWCIYNYKDHLAKFGYTSFACELKNTKSFIGFVGLQNVKFKASFNPFIKIGFRLNPNYWGQGFALEASTKCLDLGFNMF